MLSDVDIARQVRPRPIAEIAESIGVGPADLVPYGHDVAKVDLGVLSRPRTRPGRARLVLVSAITPTPAGEGKTTTTIGLGQGLAKAGESACLALREPSLGPCMGSKGGATGGGYSQIMPAGRINLHFTGDFHAITSANNLLAAMLDSHVFYGNELGIDTRHATWRRVLDMNDRSLRNIVLGLGGRTQGVPREGGFDITAASEVMAMICLAEGFDDLRERLERSLVATTHAGNAVRAKDLEAAGAMLALLRDAVLPNLVQTLEGVPAFVHGGPFANIAHGCNSVLATRMALHGADWAITEAGFAFDLGGEKFFDIKCRAAGLRPACVVLVATVRALKMHGGVAKSDLAAIDPEAVRRGLPNLDKHLENVAAFGTPAVVALNRFSGDADAEVDVVREHCERIGVPFALSEHHARGGEGALELASRVVETASADPAEPRFLYALEDSPADKIRAIATRMYGAEGVTFTRQAEHDLQDIERLGLGGLPICMAKTQASLSDDPKLLGRPSGFSITVRGVQVSAGAGFLVVLTGEMMRMPGLPRRPLAQKLDVIDGKIVGLG